MDIILIILLIIIVILGFINIYKDTFEPFNDYSICVPSKTENCPKITVATEDSNKNIQDYTISLIFNLPSISNNVQYLLYYEQYWEIFVLKNILFLSDLKDPNNNTYITLPKPITNTQELFENKPNVFHMALIAQKTNNNNKTQLFLFLNGLEIVNL